MAKELKSIPDRPRRMPRDRNEALLERVKQEHYNRLARIKTWVLVVDTNNDGP